MQPNYILENLLVIILPFAVYFLGITIRRLAIPGKNAPPLRRQYLLGIPVSLVVVSPMLPVLNSSMADTSALLITLGVIMEHGMIVNETITKHLASRLAK